MSTSLRLCLALLMLLTATGCARAGGEAFQPTLNTALTLEPGTTIGQSLNPAGGALAAVDLLVATFAAPADPDGVLTVVLRDAASGAVLDTTQIAGGDLEDAAWVRADFGTPVTVPEVVVVEASWVGATPLALWANVPPAGATPQELVNDPYRDGQLLVDGRVADGDLAFRVVGAGGVSAGVSQMGEVIRSAAARLRDQPVFTGIWVLLLAGSSALAVAGLRRRA